MLLTIRLRRGGTRQCDVRDRNRLRRSSPTSCWPRPGIAPTAATRPGGATGAIPWKEFAPIVETARLTHLPAAWTPLHEACSNCVVSVSRELHMSAAWTRDFTPIFSKIW